MKSSSFNRHMLTKGMPIIIFGLFLFSIIGTRIGLQASYLNAIYWPVIPLVLSLLFSKYLSDKDSWELEGDVLFKGKKKSIIILISEVEWLVVGKPKTRRDSMLYKATLGSCRHKFWDIIDNTLCIKTNDGLYLRLNIYFHKNRSRIVDELKSILKDRILDIEELSENENRIFKVGHENMEMRL